MGRSDGKRCLVVIPDHCTHEAKTDAQTPARPDSQNPSVLGKGALNASILTEEIMAACRGCERKNHLDIDQKKNDITNNNI